jgi:hypothetical protein
VNTPKLGYYIIARLESKLGGPDGDSELGHLFDTLSSLSSHGTWTSEDDRDETMLFGSEEEAVSVVQRLHNNATEDYEAMILKVCRKFKVKAPTRVPLEEIK